MKKDSAALKAVMYVALAFGAGLVLYEIMGGSEKWLEFEGFGALGYAMVAFMVGVGIWFYRMYKSG